MLNGFVPESFNIFNIWALFGLLLLMIEEGERTARTTIQLQPSPRQASGKAFSVLGAMGVHGRRMEAI
jgi:hypothetical protein